MTDDGIDPKSFLTGTDEASGASFPLASGLDVGAIGRTIIGSVGFTLALGATTIVDAWEDSVGGLITGVEEFIAGSFELVADRGGLGVRAVSTDGLIDVTIGAGIAAVRGAWSFNVDQFGILAPVVALGTLLATAWIVERLFGVGREVLE